MPRQKVEEKIAHEWMSGSEIIEEKAMRRGEQPLARALSGQSQSFARRRERPYGSEPSGYRPPAFDQRIDRREPDRREFGRKEEAWKKEKEKPKINVDDLRQVLGKALRKEQDDEIQKDVERRTDAEQ